MGGYMNTKECPILFSGPMIRAILDGKKTMTRRVITGRGDIPYCNFDLDDNTFHFYGEHDPGIYIKSKFEGVNRLWVRETWGIANREYGYKVVYKIPQFSNHFSDGFPQGLLQNEKWRPSIFMPRYVSRITLEITDYRVERIQEITEADAAAEGVSDIPYMLPGEETGGKPGIGEPFPIWRFRRLWDGLNTKRGYTWAVNPWVYVVIFKVVCP
jgi:hypothetical protein